MTSKSVITDRLKLTRMIAAITGATGFLGDYLLEVVREQYDRVLVLTRKPKKVVSAPDLEVIRGDVTEVDDIPTKFFEVDHLFHSGAKVGSYPPDIYRGSYFDTNVVGTEDIITQAFNHDVGRIVYTSSFFALGATGDLCRDEQWDNPPSFNHPYISTKYKAGQVVDRLVAEYKYPVISVNPTTIIGPGIENVISNMVRDFVNGNLWALPGGATSVWNFVTARDTAIGHILAAEKGRKGKKYILGGENLPIREFLLKFSDILDIKQPRSLPFFLTKIYAWFMELKDEPPITRADIEVSKRNYSFTDNKARRVLGYESKPISTQVIPILKHMEADNKLNQKGMTRVNKVLEN